QKQAGRTVDLGYNISLTEAVAIDRGDTGTLQSVQDRECRGVDPRMVESCRRDVEMQGKEMGQASRVEGEGTIGGLRQLLVGLRSIEGPKTLILISEGFVLADNTALVAELGSLAAAARTSIYALRLETPLFDASAARAPIDGFGDRQTQGLGLETLAGA